MTVGSIAGAILMALNIPGISQYGYILFLIGSIFGIMVGELTEVRSLTIMSAFFTVINTLGVYRWVL